MKGGSVLHLVEVVIFVNYTVQLFLFLDLLYMYSIVILSTERENASVQLYCVVYFFCWACGSIFCHAFYYISKNYIYTQI